MITPSIWDAIISFGLLIVALIINNRIKKITKLLRDAKLL